MGSLKRLRFSSGPVVHPELMELEGTPGDVIDVEG
jgi:hypothetical protein